ncbi:MAG: BMP family ABC transporter substrate-binding protein [Lachnospiraceae bacterium]|nr:BMP family ABC transporter substrate-binding protein [Lachnospiraceae bacterium]
MKRFSKVAALLLAAALVLGMTACSSSSSKNPEESKGGETKQASADYSKIKFGLICLHDENSTYDLNFINSIKAAKADLGLSDDQVVIKTNIPETNEAYEAALDLIDRGCNIIFADSFGHESYMVQAAKENPDVQFCHATGTLAHTEKLSNYHNAFASIYEGRFLAGVAAGLKLNEMIEAGKIKAEEAVMGYVGAFTYAEVISGYTSFYLGAKSVCPSVTMQVQFTGSWYDETAEKEAANTLISKGCVLISQHADSMGAPTACETAGVPNVSYNGSTVSACPNTFIVSSKIDWAPYFKFVIDSVVNKTEIPYDWTGSIDTGSVKLTDVNTQAAAKGTVEKLEEVKKDIIAGKIHVFDAENFTVGSEKLTTYMADVDTDPDYKGDTEVIKDGYFHESEFRSAPYFDLRIDGITLLNDKY